jgi:hypothetical protein
MTDKPDWMKVCSGINCDSCKSRKNKGKGDCLDFNIDKYPLITKYMGWEIHTSLDGNDMVAAMNKIVEKKEWHSFELYAADNCKRDYRYITSLYIFWLMQPARFFELMAKWLEEQK